MKPLHEQIGQTLGFVLLLTFGAAMLSGCRLLSSDDEAADKLSSMRPPSPTFLLTAEIDAFDQPLERIDQAMQQILASPEPDPDAIFQTPVALDQSRLEFYRQRWPVVQRAATHYGTTHREALYGSRAYWHTQSTRGLSLLRDEPKDLTEPFQFDGRGNLRVAGDMNADVSIKGSAIVHILGDLNAVLELAGVCEVVIAGSIGPNANIRCDGQLELYVGGNMAGQIQATRSATYMIDGDVSGTIHCGSSATRLTVTGDLSGPIKPPSEEGAVLTMSIEGFVPVATMLDLSSLGFTRVNATVGRSTVPPGLYPDHSSAARPVVRWVVLREGTPSE